MMAEDVQFSSVGGEESSNGVKLEIDLIRFVL